MIIKLVNFTFEIIALSTLSTIFWESFEKLKIKLLDFKELSLDDYLKVDLYNSFSAIVFNLNDLRIN